MTDRRFHPLRRTATLAALLTLAGCAGLTTGTAPTSTADAPAMAVAVSSYRTSRGLPPVTHDPALSRAAAVQAGAMASTGTLSHSVAGPLRNRLVQVGVRDVPAVENIGRGHASYARALAAWTASPGHDANLRNPDATRLGLARADGPGGPWWALIMAGDPRPGVVWRQ